MSIQQMFLGWADAMGKAIFGYGVNLNIPSFHNVTNLVSNTGVVSYSQSGVGTAGTAGSVTLFY